MKKSINTLESLYLKGYPSISQCEIDGWMVRIAEGLGLNYNSIVPGTVSKDDDIEQTIIKCEEHFIKLNQKPVIKVLSNAPCKLSYILEKRGYNFISKYHVMEVDTKTYYPQPVLVHKIHNNQALTDEWIDAYIRLNQNEEENKDSLHTVLYNIKNPVICAYYTREDIIKATCLGVISGDIINISYISTSRKHYLPGIEKSLVNKVLEKAHEKNLSHAYVRVESTNDEMIKMYDVLGFQKIYSYVYRQKDS